MAIFPSRTRPIAGNRLTVPAVGTNRQQGAVSPASAHTRSLLAQASRNGRLTSIGSVQAQLTAHAARGGGNRSGRK